MAFLFGRNNRQRNSLELCRSTKELLLKLESVAQDDKIVPRLAEELARNLSSMKCILQGTADVETTPQLVYQLIQTLITEDVLYPLANNIHRLPFEARKDAQVIFSNGFRFKPDSVPATNHQESPILQYIVNKRPELVKALCDGYEYRESAMFCGGILREALKHDCIAALILYDEPTENGKQKGLNGVDPAQPSSGKGVFWKFFDWINKCAFEVSADAFTTFRDLITRHKKLTSHYLLVNYDRFTDVFNRTLLCSQSYVTKRQSINVLSGLLLERTNFIFMNRYVESGDNLKLSMNFLKDDRRMVNYEGFHIFKVFVANPQKSIPVQRILVNNRERLLRFLPGFLEDRKDDLQFEDEKAYCIRMIEQLPNSASTSQYQQQSQQPPTNSPKPQQQQQQPQGMGMQKRNHGGPGQGALMI